MYKPDLALNNIQWLISHKIKLNHIYLIYMYKEDIYALNNLQWLICHKTKPNQTKPNHCLISSCSNPISNFLGTIPSTPTTIGITVTFMFRSFFSFHFLLFSLCDLLERQNLWGGMFSVSSKLALSLVFWPRLGNPVVSQNPREFYGSHSAGQILVCSYTIW